MFIRMLPRFWIANIQCGILFITSYFIGSVCCTQSSLAQSSCSTCHAERTLTRITGTGQEQSLFIDEARFAQSVHGYFSCRDCHRDAIGDPHPDELRSVDCAMCHGDIAEIYARGVHGISHAAGNVDAPSCAACHGSHDILSSSNNESNTHPINLPRTCATCHVSEEIAKTYNIPIHRPVENFVKGVHFKKLNSGNENSANCTSCHGSHLVLPMSDPGSPIFWGNISHTCGQCHGDIEAVYESSSHGIALKSGHFDAPTCVTCHGEHAILSSEDPEAVTYAGQIAEETCSPCHGLLKLNKKYGLIANPVLSFRNSYHGLASARGSKITVNCVSCHGAHDVLGQNDPHSSIHPDNLAETCGQCHPNVTAFLAQSSVHATPTSQADKIAAIIKNIYVWLILIIAGFVLVHNLLIYLSYVKEKYRAFKALKTVQRFDNKWVNQHILLIVSFFLLVITGFTLKFGHLAGVQLLNKIGFSEPIRGIVHRVAALILVGTALYHVYYLLFSREGKGEIRELCINKKDFEQFFTNIKYYLGLSKKKPDVGRYGYIEKAEYWAMVWGTALMSFTGFVLWFSNAATSILPIWIIKVSRTVHFYEAILASLMIFLYHFFFTIFHPEDYPLNFTGFTGKMLADEAREKYPSWYKKVKEKN